MSSNNIFLNNLKKFKNKKALILENGQAISYSQLDKEAETLSKNISNKKKLIFLLGENNLETIVGYVSFVKKGL